MEYQNEVLPTFENEMGRWYISMALLKTSYTVNKLTWWHIHTFILIAWYGRYVELSIILTVSLE